MTEFVIPDGKVYAKPHAAGACRRGGGCDRHAWVLTAAHETPRSHGARAPWGPRHLKRNGAIETACGVSTNYWRVFWDRDLHPSDPQACLSCVQIVAMSSQFDDARIA